ncbi:MAG: ribonuclease H family protein [Muribaculaceae bacterium]|nr:ribonuclease H family protein [Muribaculaceae bacterium]
MKRCYVVFRGRIPGVYDNIEDVMDQIDGYPNAMVRGYDNTQQAAVEFRGGDRDEARELGSLLARSGGVRLPANGQPDYMTIPEIDLNGWAVDASCIGNPGIMEYRGVELMTGREIFRVGPFKKGTNNIGEFLAIVHALALMEQKGENHTIYSDSITGISWVRKKAVKTQLKETEETKPLFDMMRRALAWLNGHTFRAKIMKWQTELWGEVPADFGRKN